MIHVIEHLFDPIGTLKICRRLLKPGGRLLVVTPNAASLGHAAFKAAWRGLEVPRHLFLFSRESLEICLEQAGFRVTRLRTLAETARGIWCNSQAIRTNKVIPDGKPEPVRLEIQALGTGVSVAGNASLSIRPCGGGIAGDR